MKTIRQLWDETPSGQAITDPAYQYLCAFMMERTAYPIRRMANEIPGLWDMTCEGAVSAVSAWVTKRKRLDPDYLNSDREEEARRLGV